VQVRVRLLPHARDAKVSIAGTAGTAAMVRLGRAGRRRIGIVARDWADGIHIERRRVKVADCDVSEPSIEVDDVGDGRVALRYVHPSSGVRARAYRWLPGDGTLATTTEPVLVHDYSMPWQPRATATWVVQAQAVADDADVSARAAVTLANPWWLASRSGTTWLRTRTQPFAVKASDEEAALVQMEIAGDGSGATLDHVTLRGFACADLDRALPAQLAATAMSRQSMEPRGWTLVQVAVPASLWSEPVCRVEVRIHARTADGRPALAMGAAELAPANARRLVTDRALLERLRQARKQLGRSQISQRDLRVLAAQERAASLHP